MSARCAAQKKPSFAPFVNRARIHLDGGRMCLDFPEDFGRELFLELGLKDYLSDYLSGSLGRPITVLAGRCAPGDAPEPSGLCNIAPAAPLKPEKPAQAAPPTAVPARKAEGDKAKTPVIHGKPITGEAMPIKNINDMTGACVIMGQVTGVDSFDIKKEMRGGKKSIVSFGVTDLTSTVTCKAFVGQDKAPEIVARLKKAEAVLVAGKAAYDNYAREVCISITSIEETKAIKRMDEAEVRRVELHMHTNMSALDGMADEADVVKRAAEFGHEAVAITDHGVVQAFPRAFDASKKLGIKVIYGMEAYMYDDTDDHYRETFADEYIVFDIETTGLNPQTCRITEIGAVRLRRGEIVDTFSTFVNPGEPLSPQIIDLTGITDAMLKDAPTPDEALRRFKEYVGDTPLAAH